MSTHAHFAPNDADGRSLKDKSAISGNGTLSPTDMRCPDPSAHTHNAKRTQLQDQASAAALYSTRSEKGTKGTDARINPLGPDGKLSSASAATSLKYARAQDLPSHPIVGIETQQSANTAANLANANKKSPEWWKPEQSAAAGKAALLANDYKMAPLWQPEASAAGSKAALLAHKDGVKLNLWTPQASAAGNSAATLAMKNHEPSKDVDHGYTEDGRKRALVAATGAVSTSTRKRAQSTPIPPPMYPDAANSARNALSGATIAHTKSIRAAQSPLSPPASSDSNRLGSEAMEAARIQHNKSTSRDMYTSAPPVALEVEEKKHQDALRASAISMAKKMYDVQQQHIDAATGRTSASQAKTGATAAHGHQPVTSDADIKQQAMQYIGIQEAAQKLANERLAKIGTDENAAFRSYYGYGKQSRSRLSIRPGRRRSKSNPETADSDSDDDDLRSRRIRNQMSQFNKTLAEVDAKKQERARRNLLAAAERKVHSQMAGIDKKIFDETGKMSPAMIEEWDAKARAKASANSEARMENHGRVHIGNGKYMDQADIDAVALARIQPTLDEINEKTEKRKAEEEERRLDMEQRKREAQTEKERAAELKAEEKRAKEEEKRAEKERKAEEKNLRNQEKLKSKEAPKVAAPVAADAAPAPAKTDNATADNEDDSLYRDPTSAAREAPQPTEPEASSPTSPTSPSSPTNKDSKGIKSLLNKFKRRSKHSNATADSEKPGFIGGAALRTSSPTRNTNAGPPTSYVATATHTPTPPPGQNQYDDVSSVSSGPASIDDRGRKPQRTNTGLSELSGSDYEEARDDFDEKLAPPPTFTTDDIAGRRGSPNRDSKFYEIGI